MHIFPVVAICGHLCGLHITATTAIPDAVLIGLVFNIDPIVFLYLSGKAETISANFGTPFNPFFLHTSDFIYIIYIYD